MNFKKRSEIIKKLEVLEQNFPVEEWVVADIDIWPLLKRNIFFKSFSNENSIKENRKRKEPTLKSVLDKTRRVIDAFFYKRKLNLEKSPILFTGGITFRVFWENSSFNRFLDPLMDCVAEKGLNSYMLENENAEAKLYRPEKIIDMRRLLPAFFKFYGKKKMTNETEGLKQFTSFLSMVNKDLDIDEKFLKSSLINSLSDIKKWCRLYEFIIDKSSAEYIVGLSYYSNQGYGMNLAADKLKITSIDLQHGSQGNLHPAYVFSKIPKEGYNILPKKFWVWDKESYKNIERWCSNSYHSVFMGGNPWIEYQEKQFKSGTGYIGTKPMILFTLQPLKPPIEDYFYKVIKETKESYSWWLRLHPRMSEKEISLLHEKLEFFGLSEAVTIEKASTIPLPLLLRDCSLHISRYSGSIIEAEIIGKPSLILEETGVYKTNNEKFTENNLIIPCFHKDEEKIISIIREQISPNRILEKIKRNKPMEYKMVLNDLLDNEKVINS